MDKIDKLVLQMNYTKEEVLKLLKEKPFVRDEYLQSYIKLGSFDEVWTSPDSNQWVLIPEDIVNRLNLRNLYWYHLEKDGYY